MERRLAAILVADVVGYARLMESGEADTLAQLKSRQENILKPLLARHHGRIVKLMGDGVLMEFASAVNAVECAAALQQGMASANDRLAEDRRMVFRIGVNLGDVVVEGGDLFGDGVNVAARLEALAEPGCVYVSETVFKHVCGKVELGFHDLGEQTLKNMVAPVRVYRIAAEGAEEPGAGTRQAPSSKPAIAVLPLADMSGDPAQAHLADGITEDIITEFSRFSSLAVAARNSSFQYRDKSVDVKQVGRALGVGYVMQGSVRRLGPQIRITAQLSDAIGGQNLWAERYDRNIDDLFAVQDEVVRSVVATMEHHLLESEIDRGTRKPPASWGAYDYILQAHQFMRRCEDYQMSEAPLRRAIELDPTSSEARALLAHALVFKFFLDQDRGHLNEALDLARQAAALNEKGSGPQFTMASVYKTMGEYELAGLHYDRALALNPNNGNAMISRATWLAYGGQPGEALTALDSYARRDPFPAFWYWEARATVLFQLRRYPEAIDALRRLEKPYFWARAYLVASLSQSGRISQAREEVGLLLAQEPKTTISQVLRAEPYQHAESRDHLVEGLRKAGLPE